MISSHTNQDGAKNQEHKSEILSLIINNLEVGVYVSDYYTGEIIFVNQKTADLLQNKITADELIGQTCWNVLGKYKGRCEFCAYKKLVDDKGEPIGHYTWEHYFEDYGFWGKVINQAVKWVDGRLVQITVFYDITDTKKMQKIISEHVRLEEQWKMQQNLQIVLDSLPMPIRIVDAETAKITYVNKSFLKKFEYDSLDDVKGRHVSILVPKEIYDTGFYEMQIKEILNAKDNHSTELQYITSSGKTFCGLLSSCRIDYNAKKSSVGIIADLTAEKEQKKMLMQTAKKEREANQLKSSFLSNMSHEIRTPMNAIIGLTEIELRKNYPSEISKVYSKINSSAKNLLQIINDILDLSKIEANKVELLALEFELEDVLNSALSVVAPRLEGKPVELLLNLSLEMPQMLIGDKTRLWQILRNLLDNATKFTASGSIILTVFEDKDNSTEDTISVFFAVTDTGVGMTEDQAEKIFLPYVQTHEDFSMRSAGSGLGLAISKQFCELMGGLMRVETAPNQGTTMRFTIPFARSQNSQIKLHALNAKHLAGLKILIADDSKLSIHAMKELLDSCSIDSYTAHDGEEAIKIVSEGIDGPFDIIVLDYIMDGMNGLECARLMRQYLPASTKVLILTAYENLLNKAELEAYGIDDVIEKPFVPSYFIRKLADISDKSLNWDVENQKTFTTFRNARVLVFEDNEINQEITSAMLEQFGVEIVLAGNGKVGIEILRTDRPFDLVFMDLHMPVMDGYTATKIIRSIAKYDDLPIVSLTADAMVETLNECLAIGINDVITKPTAFDDLHRVLLKWLPKTKRNS